MHNIWVPREQTTNEKVQTKKNLNSYSQQMDFRLLVQEAQELLLRW
jgi:hypothetical protein